MKAFQKAVIHLLSCHPGGSPRDWIRYEDGVAHCLNGCSHPAFKDDNEQQINHDSEDQRAQQLRVWGIVTRLLDEPDGLALAMEFCEENNIALPEPPPDLASVAV